MNRSQSQVQPPVTARVAAGFTDHPISIEIPRSSLGRPLREVIHDELEEQRRSGVRGASHLENLLLHGSVVFERGGRYHESNASAEDILGLSGQKGNQNQRVEEDIIRVMKPQRGGRRGDPKARR